MKGLQSGVRLVVRKGLLLKAAGIEAGEKPAVRIGKLGGVITGGDMEHPRYREKRHLKLPKGTLTLNPGKITRKMGGGARRRCRARRNRACIA